uniref:Uncharacterized protein n=1 Tax=Arundo donax TaxID=35708 RepID=A0A0A9AI22_ARUDO
MVFTARKSLLTSLHTVYKFVIMDGKKICEVWLPFRHQRLSC